MRENADQKNSQYRRFYGMWFIYEFQTEWANSSDKDETSTTKYDTTLTNKHHQSHAWCHLFLFYFNLFILSIILTITEQVLLTIKNRNKMLIDVITLVKKPIEHKTYYIYKIVLLKFGQ